MKLDSGLRGRRGARFIPLSVEVIEEKIAFLSDHIGEKRVVQVIKQGVHSVAFPLAPAAREIAATR